MPNTFKFLFLEQMHNPSGVWQAQTGKRRRQDVRPSLGAAVCSEKDAFFKGAFFAAGCIKKLRRALHTAAFWGVFDRFRQGCYLYGST